MEKEQSVAALKLYRNLIQDSLLMLKIKNNLQKGTETFSTACAMALEEADTILTKQFEDPLGKRKFEGSSNPLPKKKKRVKRNPNRTILSASSKLYLTVLSLVALCISIPIVSYIAVKSTWSCQAPASGQKLASVPSQTLSSPLRSAQSNKAAKFRDPLRSKDFRETRQLLPSAQRVSQAQCAAPRDHSDKTGPCVSSPCLHPDAICKGNITYECICPSPFTGRRCETNMNDCHSNPCQNGATCLDEVSSYKCHCPLEYKGVNCEQVKGPCQDKPCLQNASCTDLTFQTYHCDCPAGYAGQICQVDIDECESSPCAHNRPCVDGTNSFHCECGDGYFLEYCQIDVNECASNPCSNNAYCEDGSGEYICHCKPGYGGTHCESELQLCDSYPCYNGATCVGQLDGYTCQCSGGYGFTHCDHDLNECEADSEHILCEGGMCEDQGDGHHCYCGHGKDENADRTSCVDVSACTDNPCKNGATCRGDTLHYNCTCDGLEFSGPTCEWNTDDCFETAPCGSGGVCTDTPVGYTCSCIEGYTGTQCDVVVSYCDSSPCHNGGTCVDKVLGYKCLCDSGYNPQHCEDIDYCAPEPCYNGATCISDGRSFTCQCTPSWTGETCLENTVP